MVMLRKCGERILFYTGKKLIVRNEDIVEYIDLPAPLQPMPYGEDKKMEASPYVNILCLCVSKNHKYVAVTTESKQVVIFNEQFKMLKHFMVSRVVSQMCFTYADSLIVADKTGDVFLYDFKGESLSSVLILGHLSVVLDLALTNNEEYIITCDRDEKIRVSKFPNSYSIQSFCLGHEEFVSAVRVIENRLISASGDGTLRFWNYINGEQLTIINTNDHIDEEVIKGFREEMNSQDVEVFALPITDMQCFSSGGDIFIGVSLFHYNILLLFSINSSNLSVNYCKHVHVGEPFSFYLCSQLTILTASKLSYLNFNNGYYNAEVVQIKSIRDIELHLKSDQNISLLYKKKFDNVEEYIEKKQARLKLK